MWLPEVEIEIAFPVGPFRIHPDVERTAGPLLCTCQDETWWLAHPEGVSPDHLCPAVWVNLYEGILADGKRFLMPVYRYDRDTPDDPYPLLCEAVRRARSEWVELKYVADENALRVVPAPSIKADPENWSPHALADLIDIAFGGRYLGSWHDVAVRLCGSREFKVHVPREDYFYWMRKQFDPDDAQLNDDRC